MMLILLDRDENLIESLEYKDLIREREINGIDEIEFITSKEVTKGSRVVFKDNLGKWNEYIIYTISVIHDNEYEEYKCYAESSINELLFEYIDDKRPQNKSLTAVLIEALANTRWEVGNIQDMGLNSTNFYHTNVKNAIYEKILPVWNCEIETRIEVLNNRIAHRYIDLKNRIGDDNGKRFTYKKDIESIEKIIDESQIVTLLYGYGKGEQILDDKGNATGGYGRKINFADINNGKKYLEDEEARKKYGYGKERRHRKGAIDFSNCNDKEELLRLTREKLNELKNPKITYKLNVEDLSKYYNLEFEGVGLGDIVYVLDKEIDVTVETRVIKIKDYPLEIEDSEITLGNYIKGLSDEFLDFEKIKSDVESNRIDLTEEIKKVLDKTDDSYIDSIVDEFNKELNAKGGYVYAEKGEGLLILNAPKNGNPTQAISIKGGMIAISNHRNSDGNWRWTTFGNGDGFTANVINTGILQGGKVRWNLEDGTLLIGNSINDYSLYWDGSTLHINADIDISSNAEIKSIKDKLSNKLSKDEILQDEDIREALKGDPGTDGLPGKDGADGLPGPKGDDGKTSYIHFAYANSSDGSRGFTLTPADGKEYIGFYTDFTKEDSKNYWDYEWSKYKGEDGSDGIPGKPGTDGKTTYFHTAWANSYDGYKDFSTSDSYGKSYIGTYTDFIKGDSTNYRDYKWVRIKGEDGDKVEIVDGTFYINDERKWTLDKIKIVDGNLYVNDQLFEIDNDTKLAYADDVKGSNIIGFSLTDNTKKWLGIYNPKLATGTEDPKNYIWIKKDDTEVKQEINNLQDLIDALGENVKEAKSTADKVKESLADVNANVTSLTIKQQQDVKDMLDTIEAIRVINQNMTEEQKASLDSLEDYIRSEINDVNAGVSNSQLGIEEVQNALNQYINNLPSEIQKQINDDEFIVQAKKNFNFNSDGLVIGADGSRFNVKLDNEQLTFYQDGQEIAYINGSQLYITSSQILDSFKIYNLLFKKYSGTNRRGIQEDYVYVTMVE